MIGVFFPIPLTGVQTAPFNPVTSRAASASAENTSNIVWLLVYS